MPNSPTRKVALLASTLAVGGAERQLATLARGLKARDCTVAFFLLREMGPLGAALQSDGFVVEENILARPTRWRSLLAELRGYDLLAALDHNNVLRLLPLFARRLPPYIVLFHVPVPGTRRRGWAKALRGARAVVVVAEAQIPMLALPNGSRINVIPNGVPLPPPVDAGQRHRARNTLGLPADVTLAATACRLTAVKGIDVLIDALALLEKEIRPFLVVAGEGPERRRLEERARRKLGAGFAFLGVLGDVSPLYQAADLFVLPSYREATPMALLEAMAFGLAAVAGAVGEVPAMLSGDAGLTFTPGSPAELSAAIQTFVAAPARRRQMGEKARAAVARRYGVGRMLDEYEALFDAVIEEGGA